jgi:hypothetical protein
MTCAPTSDATMSEQAQNADVVGSHPEVDHGFFTLKIIMSKLDNAFNIVTPHEYHHCHA